MGAPQPLDFYPGRGPFCDAAQVVWQLIEIGVYVGEWGALAASTSDLDSGGGEKGKTVVGGWRGGGVGRLSEKKKMGQGMDGMRERQ
jgi:hypothetical protein